MQVDLIIQARWIIPAEPLNLVYEWHSLIINDGIIIDILPNDQALERYQTNVIEQKPHHALIPGFVNAHTHAAMTLLRGLADDLPLMDWLQNHIWPTEQRWVSESFVRDGSELAIAEMLLSGTTCFNDMYFFPEITAQKVEDTGIRAHLGLIVIDFPTIWAENADTYISKGLAVQEQWRHHPLLSFAFAPHAPYTISDAPLEKLLSFADELNLNIHMHVHETRFEVEQALQADARTPLQRLQRMGLLTSEFIAVHMTQLDAAAIAEYAKTGAHIVHCPESNLKLASGFCPVAACLDAGINVALGTDGAASNNDLDMLGEMRTAALLAKGVTQQANAVTAAQALQMATLNGARALGLEHTIGSLCAGKAADVVAVDMSEISVQPIFNPLAHLVYSTNRHQVSDVWVNGKQLVKQRQLLTIDIDALKTKVAQWQDKLSGQE
jgi:5-methylthioadenosine/S-adenosylhomocysteine deaminase